MMAHNDTICIVLLCPFIAQH